MNDSPRSPLRISFLVDIVIDSLAETKTYTFADGLNWIGSDRLSASPETDLTRES
jgi:hypothetical protein